MAGETATPGPVDGFLGMVRTETDIVRVALTARVDAYDRTVGTVDVTPCTQVQERTREGVVWRTLGQLRGVRVAWPSGGGAVLTFPIAVGDLVTLIIRDTSHAEVDKGTQVYPATPASRVRWSPSDAVALPGYTTDRAPLPSSASSSADPVLYLPNGVEFRIGVAAANEALALASDVASRIARVEAFLNEATYATPAGPTTKPAPPPFAGSTGGPICTASVVANPAPGTVTADVASTRVFSDG
jgi:hypothetical protein